MKSANELREEKELVKRYRKVLDEISDVYKRTRKNEIIDDKLHYTKIDGSIQKIKFGKNFNIKRGKI